MKQYYFFAVLCAAFLAISVNGQDGRETFTGTILSYGSGFNTRTQTSTFTVTINATTPDARAQQFLETLQNDGQDGLLKGIKDESLGTFSVAGRLGRTINVVRESNVDGKRRIFIVFERWMQFAEVRGGYRSVDYPFGFMDIYIDPVTGKGEGTYIAAARIRWKKDKQSNGYNVEIEDFATFPARLLNVRSKMMKR